MNGAENNNRINWISSLRGLLVFFVFTSHAIILPISEDILFMMGKIGVAGFFLMAGYLAYPSIGRRNIKQFALNRFIRLYPVYWLLLIITFILCSCEDNNPWTIKDLLLNMTLFHQFVGIGQIIGSAWMLSIMVIFFSVVAICKENVGNRMHIFYVLFAILSVITSIGRWYTGKALPTAIFLMSLVGMIGFLYNRNGSFTKTIWKYLFSFEVVLLTSVILSYGSHKFPYYIIAYNTAFILFYIYRHFNLNLYLSKKLGEQGFTFFLGAGIPLFFFQLFTETLSSWGPFVIYILHFSSAYVLAYVVTKYVESPLLKWGKKIEHKLGS